MSAKMTAPQYQHPSRQQHVTVPPPSRHPSQAPLSQRHPSPQQLLYNAPPQHTYRPPQYISPMVQCPSCASRFAPFAIQYNPAVTAWHTGSPIASPEMSHIATMPPSIQPQERSTAPSKIINFDNYITKVRKIYDKYSSSSGGMEYKKSGSAIKEIEAIIDTIKGQVPHVSFARKQDALNAIVDISLEMLESTRSTLAHEIRKSYYFPRLGDTSTLR